MINEEIKIEEAKRVILSTLQRIPELMDIQIDLEAFRKTGQISIGMTSFILSHSENRMTERPF